MTAEEIMLVEYQKAQDSAEHHDNLVWVTTSVILGASVILIGMLLDCISQLQFNSIVVTVIAFLGILLIAYQWYLQRGFRCARNSKYEQCKRIEEGLVGEDSKGGKYKMRQHTEFIWKDKQTIFYHLLLIVFSLVYVVIVVVAW